MLIRRYTPADRGRLFQMMRDEGSEWSDYYEAEARHSTTLERSLTYLAFEGERLCGFIRCREDDGYGVYVYDLLVDKACRGRNIGRRLMDRVRHDYPGQPLYVMSDNDGYYERQGFKPIGTVFEAPDELGDEGGKAAASLTSLVDAYTAQLADGRFQKAYRGILAFMSDLMAGLEGLYPDHAVSALYPGYLDMTYFAFTPPPLKARRLKIAIVYLHAENRFEAWLAGANRQVQAEMVRLLGKRDLGQYALSAVQPGVDAIIAAVIAEHPDFDHPEALKRQLAEQVTAFATDMANLIEA